MKFVPMNIGWQKLNLGLVLLCAGCATIAGGNHDQKVSIDSQPKGAQVYVDGQPLGNTPTEVALNRKVDHDVVIEAPGYAPAHTQFKSSVNPWLFGNLAIGGVIGLAVDIGCGSCSSLWPGSVEPHLDPLAKTPSSGTTPAGSQ